ncbi:MAG: pyruvate formate-lyase [Chloroflexi bacterium]|nr:pyruvate formate-lyase [Chloroflexota bacterium]
MPLTERLTHLKEAVRRGDHRQHRQPGAPMLAAEFDALGLTWMQRQARLITAMCEAEQVVILPDERIVFTRTLPTVPPVWREEAWARLTAGRTLHELGPTSNICADWGMVLSQGLLGRREVALATRQRCADQPETVEFIDSALETIDAVLALAERYADAARDLGREDIAGALAHLPAHPPRTFHEALQFLRLVHAVVWLGGHYHVGLGRFDQYMWPYLENDLAAGRLDHAAAEELLAEFFVSLNKDSDLYPGVQQGDNGQTLTVGGVTPMGKSGVNELTLMVLRVAHDVSMIDPKINLRIAPDTDLDLLCLASELTEKGLGFPQYSNDDVVIPGLVAHGYTLEDARNYTVAACWEFIVPGKGMDVVNIGAVSFPSAADTAIREGLQAGESFTAIMERVRHDVRLQVNRLVDAYSNLLLPPAPYYSALMDGCLETGRDLSQGLTYNNFGIHGACSANGADALAAVHKLVLEGKTVAPERLLTALETDFADDDVLRMVLQEEGPKVGTNDPQADDILIALFDMLADACEQIEDNGRGGIVRPGTGSAMYYIWLARDHENMREPAVGTTADGRKAGTPFSANLAPAPGVRVPGPISVFQSFSKIDYHRIVNGGPITIELSSTVFRNPDAIRKVAMLVRTFAQLGCQQLQVNSLNAETLCEAQLQPELHQDLIVRVWGWSGYFCELSPEYQEHVIRRHQYQLG